jgi:predicted nucleic acid-binding protein
VIFVDTSALYARLDRDDRYHREAVATLARLAGGEALLTHNYVVVESVALVRGRLGVEAARTLLNDLLAPVEVVWVDRSAHEAAVAAFLAAQGRVSLVDCASFEVMRRAGIDTAFAFDADFARHGFRTVP